MVMASIASASTMGALFLFRCRRTVTRGAALLAEIGVRADEHAAAGIVGDDFVEIGVRRATQFALRVVAIRLERMILEVERLHMRVGRDGVVALLAAGAEQLQ